MATAEGQHLPGAAPLSMPPPPRRPETRDQRARLGNLSDFVDPTIMAFPPSGDVPSELALVVIDDDTTCLDFPLPFQHLCHPCWERDQTQKGIMNKRKFDPCDHPWARIPTKNIISYKSDPLEWLNDERLRAMQALTEEGAAAGAGPSEAGSPDTSESIRGLDHRPEGSPGPAFRPLGDDEVVVIIAANNDDFRLKKVATAVRARPSTAAIAVAIDEAPSITAHDTSFNVSAGENEADAPGLAAAPDPALAAAFEGLLEAPHDSAVDEELSLTASASASASAFSDGAGDNEEDAAGTVVAPDPGLAAALDVVLGATRDFAVDEDSSLAASSFSARAKDDAEDEAGMATAHDPRLAAAVEIMLGATRDFAVDEDSSLAASSFSARAEDDAEDDAGAVTQDPMIEDAVEVMLGATRDYAAGEDSSLAASSFSARAEEDAEDTGGSVSQVSVVADAVDATLASLGRAEGEATQFTVKVKCTGEFCPSSGATAPDRPPPPTTKIHVGTTTETAVAAVSTGPGCAPCRPLGGPQPGPEKSSLPLKKRKAWRALEDSRSLPPAIIAARPASSAMRPIQDDAKAVIPQLDCGPNSQILLPPRSDQSNPGQRPVIPNPRASLEQSATPSSPTGGGRDSFTHASSNEVPHSQPCIELGLWPPEASIYDADPRHGMEVWARLKHASHHQFSAVPARSQDADDGGSMGSLTSSLDDATFEGSSVGRHTDSRIQLNHPGREIWDHQNAARVLTIAMTVQDGGGGDDDDESLLTEAPTTEPSQPVKPRSSLAVQRSATHPARETLVSSSSSSNAPESIAIQVRRKFSGRGQFSPLTRAKRDKPTFYEVPAPKQNSNIGVERVLAGPTDDS